MEQVQLRRHGWIKVKKIEMDCHCGCGKLVSLTVLQSSFWLFVTFDIMPGKHFCDMNP